MILRVDRTYGTGVGVGLVSQVKVPYLPVISPTRQAAGFDESHGTVPLYGSSIVEEQSPDKISHAITTTIKIRYLL